VDLRILKADTSIDWGMAGKKDTLSESPLQFRFNKSLDSRAPSAPDIGTFVRLPNGDDLETGSMANPDNGGKVTDYEEIWRDVKPKPGGKKAWIIESVDEGTKAFLGKIGGGLLAVTQGKKGYGARSEEWDAEGKKWTVKYEVGDVDGVPSFVGSSKAEFDREDGWNVGEKVEVKGREFVVLALEDL